MVVFGDLTSICDVNSPSTSIPPPYKPEVRQPPQQMKASDAPAQIPAVYVIVLGIDPGVANTGYGVVAQHQGRMLALDGGVVETSPGLDTGRRLADHPRAGG